MGRHCFFQIDGAEAGVKISCFAAVYARPGVNASANDIPH